MSAPRKQETRSQRRKFAKKSGVQIAGTRAACINAATLALADAGVPMRDLVASCAAGYLSGTPILGEANWETPQGPKTISVSIGTESMRENLAVLCCRSPHRL
jgi:ribonuclease PH